MHLLETKCWLFKFCFRAVSDIILWAFQNNTIALILTKHFCCCSASAWCGYMLFGTLKSIIRLLDIKFRPLKICLRAVLVVISFAYRQESCTGFGETFFPCSMHAWREGHELLRIFMGFLFIKVGDATYVFVFSFYFPPSCIIAPL